MATLSWPDKDPDEVLDYKMDWTARLDGDTITASQFTITAGGVDDLIIVSNSFTSTSATIWLSGGIKNQTYNITNRIETAGDRVMDQSVKLFVKEK